MNPDANPTPKDDEQAVVGSAAPETTITPETPAVSSEPTVDTAAAPVPPAAPESSVTPPIGPTDTPAAPVVETPGTDQQVPVAAPSPSVDGAAPSMGKKLIIVAGIAVLLMAVVAALLTLL